VGAEAADRTLEPIPSLGESDLPYPSVSLDGGTWAECPLGPCCAVCGGGDCCPPDWYTFQEVRFLGRSRARGNLMSAELTVSQGVSFLEKRMTARSVPFDVAPGYATRLGRYLGRDTENRDRFLEFCYWGLNDWRESRLVRGTRLTDSNTFVQPVTFGSLFSPFEPTDNIYDSPVGGFNRADEHFIRYRSEIDNFELNLAFHPRSGRPALVHYPSGKWRQECQPRRTFSYLFGVRVLTLDEWFDFRSDGLIEFGADSSVVSGDYTSSAHNNLVGLQFGAELMYERCKYSWGFRAKAAPCYNFSAMTIRATNEATGDPFATTSIDFGRVATRDEVALIAECGIVGTYRFRPNLILRASYDMMWVVGLAMAGDQITFQVDPPSHINANATALYQGLSLGFEYLW
jgi:hypothetical protein